MEEERAYLERLEAVYQEYEKSHDLDVALDIVPMSEDEKAQLRVDPDLRARVLVCDANTQSSVVAKLKGLADEAVNENVKLQALKEYGRLVYPKKFKEGGSQPVRLAPLKRLNPPADEWDAAFIALASADLLDYVDSSEYPSDSEYCYTRGVSIKKVKKYLKDAYGLMAAKRQALTIARGWKGDDQLGSFLTKLAANADDFSLVDKAELTGKDGEPVAVTVVKRIIVDKAAERA